MFNSTIVSESRNYVMVLAHSSQGYQCVPYHLPESLANTIAAVTNSFHAQYLEFTSPQQAGVLVAVVPIEQFTLNQSHPPLPALCLETLLDIEGLLETGFDTNIRAVLNGETTPISGLAQTINLLVQTRAASLGIETHQVLDDLYPILDETETHAEVDTE